MKLLGGRQEICPITGGFNEPGVCLPGEAERGRGSELGSWGRKAGEQCWVCRDLHQVGSVLEVFYPGSSALWAGG